MNNQIDSILYYTGNEACDRQMMSDIYVHRQDVPNKKNQQQMSGIK